MGKVRINIGCGQSPTPGWKNLDNSPSIRLAKLPLLVRLLRAMGLIEGAQLSFISCCRENLIEFADVTKPLPLPTGVVDVIYSSHMFHHLDPHEASGFLKEARRVLRPGGIIRLAVPDAQALVQLYTETHDADSFVQAFLMPEPRPTTFFGRARYLFAGHRGRRWMYDGDSLSRLLREHGFTSCTVLLPGETQIVEHQGLDLRERAAESIYVEAINP